MRGRAASGGGPVPAPGRPRAPSAGPVPTVPASRCPLPAAVLYRLHVGKNFQVETLPTVGFNVETVRIGKLTLNMWVRRAQGVPPPPPPQRFPLSAAHG